jgi:hypothetical protein
MPKADFHNPAALSHQNQPPEPYPTESDPHRIAIQARAACRTMAEYARCLRANGLRPQAIEFYCAEVTFAADLGLDPAAVAS